MADALILALPSKGRIHEEVLALFGACGLALVRAPDSRGYSAALNGFAGIEVRLASASEIAAGLASGTIHLGVTGLDLLHERPRGLSRDLGIAAQLGISQARVVVAVPEAWIDVTSIADLRDAAARFHERTRARFRVATKFRHLTRRFFSAHGVLDYRIVPSLGATEGAPAAGAAELIVDITETGATLAANQLRAIEDGIVLASQAVLAASLIAPWSEERSALARRLVGALAAKCPQTDVGFLDC